jgi:hypothetical protein
MSGMTQTAGSYICQNCLLSIDGRPDLQAMQEIINARHAQEDCDASSEPKGNKVDKSTGGKKQKTEG